MDICTDPNFLKALNLVMTLIKIATLCVPFIIIVVTSIDIVKAITNNGLDEVKKTGVYFLVRIFWGIMIFFIPTLVGIVMSSIDDSKSINNVEYQSCIKNIDNIEYYEKQAQIKKEQELADVKAKEAAIKTKEKARLQEIIARARSNANTNNNTNSNSNSNTNDNSNNGNNDNTGSTGTVIGQKYILTEAQLRGLAMKCQREQNSPVGAAAEASLMANRFELYGSRFGTGGSGLYNYVATSGWWGNAGAVMKNTSALRDDILAAVKQVLVLGNRTLPFYIDEHDCIYCGSYGYDVTKIVTNGKTITDHSELKNHNNYVRNNTVIYNKYGSVYTFYTFPNSSSDPFGYTKTAKNKYDALNRS